MTAKMLHLAMWYAGHDPGAAAQAALTRGGAWDDYDFAGIFFAHGEVFYEIPVEQRR